MSHRPMFKRMDAFTVLKPIRLTSTKVLQIGDKIKSGEFRVHRLTRWYRSGMIAQHGCKWSIEYLESVERKHQKKITLGTDKQMIQSYYQPVLAIKEEPKAETKKAKREYTKKAKK